MKHVSSFVDRHGKTRYRFRMRGRVPRYFKSPIGTPEFDFELEAFREGRVAKLKLASSHARYGGPQSAPVVYFIGGQRGPVKIGMSVNPAARLRSMQPSSPAPLFILAIAAGGREVERQYHKRFATHRLYGEWFDRTPELATEIEHLANGSQIESYTISQAPENTTVFSGGGDPNGTAITKELQHDRLATKPKNTENASLWPTRFG